MTLLVDFRITGLVFFGGCTLDPLPIRHTAYFRIGALWFLRPRAIDTAFRRWREAMDILYRTARFGGFAAGNIEPRRQTVKAE